jgi:flavin-dependent dehydrogenase
MYDVLIAGGGVAGLGCAIDLARRGARVAVVEKQRYPFHRVCGEYVSNEVLPYLDRLGVDPVALGATRISRFSLHSPGGKRMDAALELGGFGLSRYVLDAALAEQAARAGADVQQGCEVRDVRFEGDEFSVLVGAQWLSARVVLGCHGKRSKLDRTLGRSSFARRSDYVAVKRHHTGEFPDNLVSLYTFADGYCGVSRVERGNINVCYLTTGKRLRSAGSVEALTRQNLAQNAALRAVLQPTSPQMDRPLVISQIDFRPKPLVDEHVLMLGDAAAVIHPLCGNGMAMALRTAHFASGFVAAFLRGESSRSGLERRFAETWRAAFGLRRRVGALLQPLLETPRLSQLTCGLGRTFPTMATRAIRLSHGRPF